MRAGQQKAQAAASVSWPTVAGSVLESSVSVREAYLNPNDQADKTVFFTPHVRYAYVVAGAPHEASIIRFGHLEGTAAAAAQATCDKYPAGAAVTVHYDTGNPAIATLETVFQGSSQYIWSGILMVLGVAIVAVAIIYGH